MNYSDFLQTKIKKISDSGFEVKDLNENLFDFQRYIVEKALRKGKYAIFADCGLGKTLMQLEWAHKVAEHTNQPVLILAPLAVSGQTIKEGNKFGIEVFEYSHEATPCQFEPLVFITNYEQLDKIDVSVFSGVVLDESSILKNFTGVYRNQIIDKFRHTPYKLACTATPSPNDDMEICNHAEFLGYGTRTEILAMYFTHDGGETAKWKLKGHAYNLFWKFVSEWSVFLSNPEDLGFNGEGYTLPALNYIEREIKTKSRDNGKLFNDTKVDATSFNTELRITLIERIEAAAELINSSNEPFIVWVNQDEEDRAICELVPDAVSVKGSDKPETKKGRLLGFAENDFRVLVTKKKIAQFGLNYQNCNNQIFASLDFSFEGLYQAIRRSYRFGQTKEVNIYLITTDTMTNVIQAIKTKEEQFNRLKLTFKILNNVQAA